MYVRAKEGCSVGGLRLVLGICGHGGWTGAWGGVGNMGQDPVFAREPDDAGDGWGVGSRNEFGELLSPAEDDDFGDLHLCSEAGRWDRNSEKWVRDDLTSPCIDSGCPASCVGEEPWPHGERINMGAYGGTAQASLSLSCSGNVADLNDDDSVSFQDFARLAAKWNMRGLSCPEDLDSNTMVDLKDVRIFCDNWLAGK